MFQENAGFKERITSYEQAYKYEVFDKIIRNTYGSREEIAGEMDEAGFRIGEVRCIVLCMRYEDSSYRAFVSENLTIKNLVKEWIGIILDREFELFDTTARETICVLAMRNDENEDMVMRELISRINTEIAYCYDVEIAMGAGGSVDSIWRIGDSYAQAKAVIRYNETSEKKISLYSELEQMKDLYYYPQELEEKIYNYVAVGKAKDAENILWKIYEENFGEHSEMLSVGAIEMLKSRIGNTIVSIAQKNGISIDSAMWPFGGEQNVRKCFELACSQVVNAAEQIAKNKKKSQEYSVSKIREYVKENYCDSNLSIQEIAHKFGYTENYLSGLFKSLYGENLSAVIEKLRIEKACECIRDTNMKVEEIAEAVGYTSATSFRRAFKRIVGVSPKEYKEM